MKLFPCLVSIVCWISANAAGADGTEVLKWKDGRKAVFMLAFDDSAPSQLQNVVPELEKRKIVGTFFLVTGNSLYANLKTKWEAAARSPYVVIANHTFTHKGVLDPAELDQELAKCNEVIYKLHPERKQPRLLGFGQPGGVPWVVSKDEFKEALAKHHLVNRPPFYGPPMHYKSKEAVVGAVDTALAKGEMGHLDFHGVGGDWLTTPLDWFVALMDKLEASRDQLWITDTVSWHQYLTERQSAEIKVLQNNNGAIRVSLTSKADPAFYDFPLTLASKVPAGWKSCVVTQGTTKTEVPVREGVAQYDAVPGVAEIVLRAGTGAR
jgi:peptidoglycan/xylan/chitin deacetylase (PgdA/CDA1 family)